MDLMMAHVKNVLTTAIPVTMLKLVIFVLMIVTDLLLQPVIVMLDTMMMEQILPYV